MKKHFSFSKLLYNDKLMIVLSVVIAISIWASVLWSSSNVEERSIPVTVTIDLTNSYAYQSGIRVLGETSFQVDVNVSGSWSVINKLSENDFRVRPDLTVISGAGDIVVPLTVSRNSAVADYDINSVSPSSVTVACDYWVEGTTFRVETDVTALKVADAAYQIGQPVIDLTAFPSGNITVNGPKSIVEKIDKIVARVETEETITENTRYDVPLVALDKNGNTLDMTYCEFKELQTGTVAMTVPIWEERIIEIGYTLKNAPAGMDADDLLIVEPSKLDLLGTTAELDTLQKQLENIGEIDFALLSLTNDAVEFPLTIPSTVVAVNEAEAVSIRLNREGLAQKAVTVTATSKNVVVKGNIGKYTVTVPQQTLSNILLVGNKSAVTALTTAAITLEVDIGNGPEAGTKQYTATVKINGHDDVWVYQDTPLTLFVTLTDPAATPANAEKPKDN